MTSPFEQYEKRSPSENREANGNARKDRFLPRLESETHPYFYKCFLVNVPPSPSHCARRKGTVYATARDHGTWQTAALAHDCTGIAIDTIYTRIYFVRISFGVSGGGGWWKMKNASFSSYARDDERLQNIMWLCCTRVTSLTEVRKADGAK